MRLPDHVPKIEIGRWPTPVRHLPSTTRALGCEVWAKLENEAGAWGGNKVRKLEYLLAEAIARDARTLVAYGAGSSYWAAAVAYHGARRGYRVAVGLGGDVPSELLELYDRLGTVVCRLPGTWSSFAAAARARLAAGWSRVMVLPAGGSGGLGDLGSAGAGLEIAGAIRDGVMPRPEKVFVACGTGGTSAGVAIGLGAQGLSIPVVAVRVTPRPFGTRALVRRRVAGVLARMGAAGHKVLPAPVIQEDSFHRPGYGRPNESSEAATRLVSADGLDLDGTYTAKAFAALVAEARRGARGPLLFLHTAPGPVPPG